MCVCLCVCVCFSQVVELDAEGGVVSSEEVPSALVHKGDLIKVLPGAKVPADGIIVQGSSFLNEVMITGTPLVSLLT